MQTAEAQDSFAAALLRPGSLVPAGVITARGDIDEARFAVYRNNVFVSLTNALARRFPVTERLVGADFFRGTARAYAADHKPTSPLMFEYGDTFADFVETFPPAASVPYLADVARLEAAWSDAYHAADASPLQPEDLARLDPEDVEGIVLQPHPAARLIRSVHPIGSIWGAHQGTEPPQIGTRTAETVLVVRPDHDVSVHILPAGDASFAEALLGGEPLGVAAQAAVDEPTFDFGRALIGLVSIGAFRALEGEV